MAQGAHAGRFLSLEKVLMSVKGLDHCEMLTRDAIKATPHGTGVGLSTIFHQYPFKYSTSKFHDNHSIQRCLCRFYVCCLSAKSIPVVVAVTIPSLIESSLFLFQSKLLILLYIFPKHITSFWWLILFFIDLFFICSLWVVICKKYTNANGKDSKSTNAIDIRITGGDIGSALGWGGGTAGGAGSFIAFIASISAFFTSFKTLSFNLFI